MQCKCGGETSSHTVIRKKKEVGSFEQCKACGRVLWIVKPKEAIIGGR
jgi:uncharacterized Zn finger protein